MDEVNVKREDQVLMSLVHYFVTQENYAPIYVHGVQNEIWLENVEGPYRVIRINSTQIINEEQFKFDQYRIKDILRQIKNKTMSFKVNALNINLNEDTINFPEGLKDIDNINIHEISDFENNKDIASIFPKVKNSVMRNTDGFELIFNVTRDINKKTEEDNKRYEKIFTPKKPIISYIIVGACLLMFCITMLLKILNVGEEGYIYVVLGANHKELLKLGQVFRLITYAFLHVGILHLATNMYSLLIIGPQIESKFGRWRFAFIYFMSAIAGGLLSAGFGNSLSVGASGAIFGLLGSMLYFGLKFRLYLKDSLLSRVLPVILINLVIGFATTGIDNWCHIGGLVAGFFATMAVGIPGETKKSDTINGIILLTLFIAFLSYVVFIH